MGFDFASAIDRRLGKPVRIKNDAEIQGYGAIAADGGIHPDTAPLVVEAGATVLVAGSSVYNSKASVKDNLATLYAAIDENQSI